MIMHNTISLGKIAYSSKYRVNAVDLELELKILDDGHEVFSVCGIIWNASHTHLKCAGQCLDELVPFFKSNGLFKVIYQYWKKYHLNDMHAGTPEQEELVKGLDYDEARAVLKRSGLYIVTLPDGTSYRYGTKWLYEPIPEPDLTRIKTIMKGDLSCRFCD